MHHPHHMMRGFLSFMVMWIVREEPKTGMEIAKELEERKGNRPSPGTIYPVLKIMTRRGLLQMDEDKKYSLTDRGREELDNSLNHFFTMFFDISEMRRHCKCGGHPEDCPHE